jgi:cation diffusion facilitator family transporter
VAEARPIENNRNYHRSVQYVLWLIMFLNLVVVLGKGLAGWMADSLTVMGDALHSTTDMLNNVVGLVLIRYASAPPDRGHPYGHGKFETLGAFSVAGFLLVTCFEIATRAINQLFAAEAKVPAVTFFTVAIMIATIIINTFVARYETRRGRELGSELLIADSTHTRSDIYVSISVLASLFFIRQGYGRIDGLFALGISILIAYNGYQLFRQTVPILVDAAMIDPRRIEQIALTIPGVEQCKAIRSRGRPGDLFIEMIIIVEAKSLTVAHAITEQLEQALGKEFGRAEITIHFEPKS